MHLKQRKNRLLSQDYVHGKHIIQKLHDIKMDYSSYKHKKSIAQNTKHKTDSLIP